MEGFCPLAFPCSGDIIVRTQTINPNETLQFFKIYQISFYSNFIMTVKFFEF